MRKMVIAFKSYNIVHAQFVQYSFLICRLLTKTRVWEVEAWWYGAYTSNRNCYFNNGKAPLVDLNEELLKYP